MKLQKLIRYAFLSALILFPACGGAGGCSIGGRTCTSSLPAGTSGGCCRRYDAPTGRCDAGLVCNSNTCEPCGGSGERCCGGNSCDASLTCETDTGRCGDCGEPGERCCASGSSIGTLFHVCTGDASCDVHADRCEGTTTTTCTGGVRLNIPCRLAFGCTTWVVGTGHDAAGARECAESVGCNVIDEPLRSFNFCGVDPMRASHTVSWPGTSREAARDCLAHTNTDWTITEGCCEEHVGTALCIPET
ncbi:MAG: hypothetical protein R3B13_13795 [Polyangiaceae bacterium]